MKNVWRFSCFFILLISIYSVILIFQTKKEFSILRIYSDFGHDPSFSNYGEEEALDKALSQPFYYLGRGNQCYAFSSEDQKYVIKFFINKLYKPYSFLFKIHVPHFLAILRVPKLHYFLNRYHKTFTSFQIAFADLPEESQLIYVRLDKTQTLERFVQIVDNLGGAHTVALNDVEFVLQRKGVSCDEYFNALMEKKDIQSARRALTSLFEILVERNKKGIVDEDAPRINNFGFIADQPMLVDVGRLIYDSHHESLTDLKSLFIRLSNWLNKTHPDLIPILNEVAGDFINPDRL